ncbi:putative structural protein [Agrobacterium phage OLIVR2]|uniref:Putative structural protein n=1 Tax=Agrobacterium phage OLIVR1 TaxID=2723769 RepID=A0A858MR80_9CAUD|nr:hypothetical protein [Xanthomonas campestris]YP_010107121.1 virion structural protein [Agrobacterium phage OLIVR1]QIW87389.1 putative structural protein [Agrobacterium phage OLIVR2]QIW87496.1 putative structural protein [Agrobacterium phage OLIVR3]MCF8861664.1 hypothetical protein [Xanthomonas campestris pv. campestris]QIW87282.1 putative structural protein [Agrobacterium phage OLIVR1]
MAPLTWRNVDAPNFSGTAQSLQLASSLLSNATSGLNEGLDRFNKNRRADVSGSLIMDALRYTDPDAYANALRSGTVGAGVRGRDLNPEARQFLQNRERDLINNQGYRLQNDGRGIQNQTSQFNLDQGISAAARADEQRKNFPQANEVMTQARALMESGDPAQIARGRQMMTENSRLFTAAGMTADEVANFMGGNTNAASTGMQFNRSVAENTDYFNERYRNQGQKGLLDSIVKNAVDVPDALQKLRSVQGMDAKTLENLTKDITEKGEIYFPKPDVLSSISPAAPNSRAPSVILQEYAQVTPRAAKNTEQSGVPYIGYDNQNARRNLPVSNRMVDAMSFLPELGIEMRVFSGGQKDQASGTGSVRHNDGDAADVEFYRNGKRLDWSNPADVPIFQEIVRRGKERGLTGFGAGDGYMRKGTMHIGFGNPGVWGAGGKGANAAPWLRDAFNSASQGTTPSEMVRDAVVQGGGARTGTTASASSVPPVGNTGNPATTIIQESTRSNPNAPIQVAPTAVDNLEATPVSEQVANRQESTSDTVAPSSNNVTDFRTDDRGVPIGNDIPVTSGATPAQNEVTASAPRSSQAPAPLTPSQLLQNAQTAANTGIIDTLSNSLAPVEQQLAQRPYTGQDTAAIVRTLKGTKDAPGVMSSVPETAITEAINQIMRRTGMPADVAAVLAQNSVEGRDLGGWFGTSFMSGDRFGGPTEGRSGSRINVERAIQLADNFRNAGSNQAGNVSPGVGRLNTVQNQAQAQAQVQLLASQAAALQERILRASAALQADPSNGELRAMLQQAQAQLEMVNTRLNSVSGSGQLAPYTGTNINR